VSALARVLTEDDLEELPTCGIVHLELRIAEWLETIERCGQLRACWTPKMQDER
jgi:hypothetical protein